MATGSQANKCTIAILDAKLLRKKRECSQPSLFSTESYITDLVTFSTTLLVVHFKQVYELNFQLRSKNCEQLEESMLLSYIIIKVRFPENL